MITSRRNRGFALVVTLVLMALIITVIVAYLANTRTNRSTSSVYANRLKAKMMAESGLAAATRLLYDNTKTGNYITAMPAPAPAPTTHWTEIYRPDNTSTPDDFLRLDNAVGEVLASTAVTTLPAPAPQIDPRPTATPLPIPPTNGSFGLPAPSFTSADSFDFNQVVRIGASTSARLINPDAKPSYGQWVRVRNSSGDLIGRYAFVVEDESMKVNLNWTGNKLGAGEIDFRPSDLLLPVPSGIPGTQPEEIDPSGTLPISAPRVAATKALVELANPGSRLASNKTVGLLNDWAGTSNLEDYVHILTTFSKDDLTTARGWQRMDLNAVVASNTPPAAAQKISDWIRDAWTGSAPLSSLQPYQVYGDDRLRLQLAANIVDYTDADDTPVDMGDVDGYPIIGIEKIPYIVEVDVVYTATPQNPDTPGRAIISMKFRFNFMNLFEKDLPVGTHIKRITLKGVPVINKNGEAIFDHSADIYTITVGGTPGFPDAPVPWGGDNVAYGVAGAKTFVTGQILSEPISYTSGGSPTTFESGLLEVTVFDADDKRLDSLKISLRDLQAKYSNASPQPVPNDFLEARNSAASINATYSPVVGSDGTISTLSFGDPRYRPMVVTSRTYNLTRTDTGRFTPTTISGDDKAEIDSRASAVDWYDYVGDRPLVFLRNAPMLSNGELGNVSDCEYPWRTVYLQYAGRSKNTNVSNLGPEIEKRRGSSAAAQTNPDLQPQDYVLMDLFRTGPGNARRGGFNINSQYNVGVAPFNQGAFAPLFLGVPVGGGIPGGTAATPVSATAAGLLATAIANRRSAVAPEPTGGPGPAGGAPPIDNNPRRPYFTIGQLASDLSLMVNQSENTTTTGNSRSRSTVNYSVIRNSATNKNDWSRNYGTDMQVEEPYRKVVNAITTHGNVFRVLYVGQSVKDVNRNGDVDANETSAEYLGEAVLERVPVFGATTVGTSSVTKTTDSKFKIIALRPILE